MKRLASLASSAGCHAPPGTGSLIRRMIGVSALWIVVLLGAGGYALDRVLSSAITHSFDAQLEYVLTALVASAEVDSEGGAFLNRPPADQRFLEPYSGLYFQISAIATAGGGSDEIDLPSRSLWDRKLEVSDAHNDVNLHTYDSRELEGETCAWSSATSNCPARRRAGASRSPRAARISTTRSTC